MGITFLLEGVEKCKLLVTCFFVLSLLIYLYIVFFLTSFLARSTGLKKDIGK